MSDHRTKLVVELEALLPSLLRRVFVAGHDSPLTELPFAQMRLLRLLQDQPGLRVSQASAELGTTPSAVTQMCHRLSTAGYLDRSDDSDDGRGKRLTLSAKGLTLLTDRKQQRVRSGLATLEAVSEEDIEALLVAMRKVIEATPRRSDAEPMELIEVVEPHAKPT